MTRYIVGTRDTQEVYRAVRVDAENAPDARAIALRRMEDVGVYARAVSARPVNALGQIQ